jgi:hypothetical protein
MSAVEAIAIDWSGARSKPQICAATARDGRLERVEPAASREAVVAQVLERVTHADEPLAVGLDFSFSFPRWFLEDHGLASARDLWGLVADKGESWLDACDPPFWGRPGRGRPPLVEEYRVTERALGSVAGIRPKSVFQIGGAGAVGTGSLRGMPFLGRFADAGFSIWPFDPPAPNVVVEIYPRLLTGAVVKSSDEARRTYIERLVAAGSVPPELASAAVSTEDAFDAAVSAVVMSTHDGSLTGLPQATDMTTLLEGAVWVPPVGSAAVHAPGPGDRATAVTTADAYSPRYVDALAFAARLHVTQRRKGSSTPYVSHLLAVSALVWEAGGDEDQAIAGLLHDAAEDRGGEPTLQQIRQRFGARVARIVEDCTDSWEDPKPPWRDRKEAHLAHLRSAPLDSLLVVAADKLHNAEGTAHDVREEGPAVWDRFRGGRDGTIWYYRQVYEVLLGRLEGSLVPRLGRAVAELESLAGI